MKTLDELRAARDAALDVYYDESRVPVDAGDPRRVVREAAYEAYKSASDAYLTKLEEVENENA